MGNSISGLGQSFGSAYGVGAKVDPRATAPAAKADAGAGQVGLAQQASAGVGSVAGQTDAVLATAKGAEATFDASALLAAVGQTDVEASVSPSLAKVAAEEKQD